MKYEESEKGQGPYNGNDLIDWLKHAWKPKMAATALSQTLLLAALPLVNG